MRISGLSIQMLIVLVIAVPAAMEAARADAAPTEPAAPERTGETDNPEESEEPADAAPSIDERLDALISEVSSYEEREITRCLSIRSYRSVKTLNTDYLLFSRGNVFWLNKLKRTCHSLKWNDLPVFESRGSTRVCEGDPFYPTNSMDLQMGMDASGRPRAIHGTCFLGSFETITAEQAALLMGQD